MKQLRTGAVCAVVRTKELGSKQYKYVEWLVFRHQSSTSLIQPPYYTPSTTTAMSGKENRKSDREQEDENRQMEAKIQSLKDEIRDLDQISEEKLRAIQEMQRLISELEVKLAAAQAARKK